MRSFVAPWPAPNFCLSLSSQFGPLQTINPACAIFLQNQTLVRVRDAGPELCERVMDTLMRLGASHAEDCSVPYIENMRADASDLGHRVAPVGHDPILPNDRWERFDGRSGK